MKHTALLFALSVAATSGLCACAATPNPDLERLEPVAAKPVKPAQLVTGAAAAAAAVDGEAGDPAPKSSAPPVPIVGEVGGLPVGVDEFLSRLWMRDSGLTREVLEQIVYERLVLLESERLGLAVAPEAVEEVLADAYAAMGAKLAGAGSKLTVTEHIRRNLEMDPAFYESHLRSDAIVQLLAERCVRAWALESERALVDVLELKDEDTLDAVRAALDAGGDFDEIAAQHGGESREGPVPGGLTRLSIVRSETHPLSRLAFATPIGEIGGPLVQGKSYLLLRVAQRLPAESFTPGSDPARIERSLDATPVDNLEYVQWRAAMVRRYPVGLEPFFELVGDRGPQ